MGRGVGCQSLPSGCRYCRLTCARVSGGRVRSLRAPSSTHRRTLGNRLGRKDPQSDVGFPGHQEPRRSSWARAACCSGASTQQQPDGGSRDGEARVARPIRAAAFNHPRVAIGVLDVLLQTDNLWQWWLGRTKGDPPSGSPFEGWRTWAWSPRSFHRGVHAPQPTPAGSVWHWWNSPPTLEQSQQRYPASQTRGTFPFLQHV